MKQLIPVILAGAAIIVGITTGLAQAFSGHRSLSPYLIGYGCAALLVAIAAVMAIVAARRERAKPIVESATASGVSPARGGMDLQDRTLKDQIGSLTEEIFQSLDEIGPRPQSSIDYSMTDEEILNSNDDLDEWRDRVDHIYLARFQVRVTRAVHELAAEGISDPELNASINLRKETAESLRIIGERLISLSARLKH